MVNEKGTQEQKKKQDSPNPWLDPFKFKPGISGNPGGRKKGSKSMKVFAREYLASLPEEERLKFLNSLPSELVWKMSEGAPRESIELETKETPYDKLTREQKLERIRRCLEGVGKDEGPGGPDILNGGDIELPENGKDPQESGKVLKESETKQKEGDSPIAEKPPKDNTNNNLLDNPATPE